MFGKLPAKSSTTEVGDVKTSAKRCHNEVPIAVTRRTKMTWNQKYHCCRKSWLCTLELRVKVLAMITCSVLGRKAIKTESNKVAKIPSMTDCTQVELVIIRCTKSIRSRFSKLTIEEAAPISGKKKRNTMKIRTYPSRYSICLRWDSFLYRTVWIIRREASGTGFGEDLRMRHLSEPADTPW